MRDYHSFKVWEKAHLLALATYKTTMAFPPAERFGLTNQMRRASVSIAANIAEGCGRSSRAQFAHFLDISAGSASELQDQLLLARDLNFLSEQSHKTLDDQVTEVKQMLASLMRKLRADG